MENTDSNIAVIVAPNDEFRESFAAVLRTRGYLPRTHGGLASLGEEAIPIGRNPDAMVLVEYPSSNGTAIAAAISLFRRCAPFPFVVVYTFDDQGRDARRAAALDNGADLFTARDLATSFQTWLDALLVAWDICRHLARCDMPLAVRQRIVTVALDAPASVRDYVAYGVPMGEDPEECIHRGHVQLLGWDDNPTELADRIPTVRGRQVCLIRVRGWTEIIGLDKPQVMPHGSA